MKAGPIVMGGRAPEEIEGVQGADQDGPVPSPSALSVLIYS